jgi:hypothetical protein
MIHVQDSPLIVYKYMIYIIDYTPNYLSTASWRIRNDVDTVGINQSGLGETTFTSASPIYAGDTITLQFDSSVGFTSGISVFIQIGASPQIFSLTSQTTSTITLTNAASTRAAGSVFSISIYSMLSGPSIKPSFLNIITKRGTYLIDTLQTPIFYTVYKHSNI